MPKKVFKVGDVIRQSGSNDEGRIVRIVNYSEIRQPHGNGNPPKGLAFVVSLPAGKHPPVREALWREEEIAAVVPR